LKISKLFFAGIFLALILGASFVSANTNMQSQLTSLQAQETQLLGVNKTLKAKIQEVKEEIAKKKKGIIAGLVVGGVGGAAGAGGMIYARNKNAQTKILKKEIKELKEIPNLVDDIMALAIVLCCGEVDACVLSEVDGFTAKKSELLVMDVLQLKKMKSDLQRQKKEMDEFIKLIDEMRELEDEYTGNRSTDLTGYEEITEEASKWCPESSRAEISDIKNNINLLKAVVAPDEVEEEDGCDYVKFPNLKKLNTLVEEIKKLRVEIESEYDSQVSGKGSEALCGLEEAEKLECNNDYEKKYGVEKKFKKEKTRLEALKNEYAVRRKAVIEEKFKHLDDCPTPPAGDVLKVIIYKNAIDPSNFLVGATVFINDKDLTDQTQTTNQNGFVEFKPRSKIGNKTKIQVSMANYNPDSKHLVGEADGQGVVSIILYNNETPDTLKVSIKDAGDETKDMKDVNFSVIIADNKALDKTPVSKADNDTNKNEVEFNNFDPAKTGDQWMQVTATGYKVVPKKVKDHDDGYTDGIMTVKLEKKEKTLTTLKVTVQNSDNSPATGAKVRLSDGSQTFEETTDGTTGMCAFNQSALNNKSKIYAISKDRQFKYDSTKVDDISGAPNAITIKLTNKVDNDILKVEVFEEDGSTPITGDNAEVKVKNGQSLTYNKTDKTYDIAPAPTDGIIKVKASGYNPQEQGLSEAINNKISFTLNKDLTQLKDDIMYYVDKYGEQEAGNSWADKIQNLNLPAEVTNETKFTVLQTSLSDWKALEAEYILVNSAISTGLKGRLGTVSYNYKGALISESVSVITAYLGEHKTSLTKLIAIKTSNSW